MADFSFIQDDRFRASLEADTVELTAASAAASWKAVHILAGSIIEAVLIDYLIDTSHPTRAAKDPLRLELADAIDICKGEGVLTDKTAALCHVIRGYRNLIHPGRLIRLAEAIDEQSGRVSIALVEMIVAEVGKVRAVKVGYTAEQLARKLEGDPTASEILKHLVPRLSPSEIEKLVLKVIPARYADAMELEGADAPYPRALRSAYHAALAGADEPVKRRVAAWYVDVVRNEQQRTVQWFQEAFLRAPNLPTFETDDRMLVIDHLLQRLRRERTEGLFEAASGIGPYLNRGQASLAVDVVVQEIVHGETVELDRTARDWLSDVFNADTEHQSAMNQRLEAWKHLYTDKGQDNNTTLISNLLSQHDELDDLPF